MRPPATIAIPVDHVSAAHVAARTARALAADAGLPGVLPEHAAVIASELAGNLDKHAHDGVVHLQRLLVGVGVEIVSSDRGPGMTDLRRCLTDGHTTTGTLGVGLGAVQRMSSDFVITTEPGEGTLAAATLRAPGEPAHRDVALGHVLLPAAGEEHSGDTVAVHEEPDATTLLLVDGLGHGEAAGEAALTAADVFHRDPARPVREVMRALHRGIRHTRGAAAAVVRVGATRLDFCGIGNITTAVLTGTRNHHLLSRPGVVGLRVDEPTEHRVDLPPGSTVVMHSDGVDGRWLLASPAHRPQPPPLLAAHLLRDHRNHRDDAAVLVARPRARAE
ncbi:anti-sigma regulatory factor (Ser/Thr protein kinase) [Saccharothrix carnea]|uniref:Anti-sigma regulatory factor (Ser/Thr protein kinase) n=1 Tax=Saccharothrix carnea TaxID=1280637 RepID=A0A2P8I0R0_SACCR|nr:anti-sigma regulatory factor (Ser/Thr protein kinase) [Saccharothrix carnea]